MGTPEREGQEEGTNRIREGEREAVVHFVEHARGDCLGSLLWHRGRFVGVFWVCLGRSGDRRRGGEETGCKRARDQERGGQTVKVEELGFGRLGERVPFAILRPAHCGRKRRRGGEKVIKGRLFFFFASALPVVCFDLMFRGTSFALESTEPRPDE